MEDEKKTKKELIKELRVLREEKEKGIFKGLIERKKIEKALLESKEKYRTVFESTGTATVIIEEDTTISMANSQFEKLSGYKRSCVENKMKWTYFVDPRDLEKMEKYHTSRRDIQKKVPAEYEFRFIDRKGKSKNVLLKIGMIPGTKKSVASLMDITTRKQAEELFKNLFTNSPNAIFLIQDKKIKMVNQQFLKETGYNLKELIGVDSLNLIYHEDRESVRKNTIKILKEKLSFPFEYRGIRKDGELRWILQVVSSINYHGKKAILGNFKDITRIKNVEQKLEQSYEKLQKTMDAIISTMSKIIEAKDPYTVGHQQRVSQLATALAREWGLLQDRIEGIRIASLVHDIGKISVPTEILSKPSIINDLEFNLIKNHPETGYDILKSINFSHPIAQITLQHHERIDGSGYPNHLNGEDILLDAKIIGVADVVEAMSSHRPYRPALGTDKALEEIEKNKGTLYDAALVDLCIDLFKKKHFAFDRSTF